MIIHYHKVEPIGYRVNPVYWGLNIPKDSFFLIIIPMLIRNKTEGTLILKLATVIYITLLGLGLIKINTVLANFNNPRPSLTLND